MTHPKRFTSSQATAAVNGLPPPAPAFSSRNGFGFRFLAQSTEETLRYPLVILVCGPEAAHLLYPLVSSDSSPSSTVPVSRHRRGSRAHDRSQTTMDVLGLVIALFFIVLLVLMFVVFPPQEFANIGLTFEQLIGGWLGDEQVKFVSHTMRQLTATMVFHSTLPLLAFLVVSGLDPSYSRFVGESVSDWMSQLQPGEAGDDLDPAVTDFKRSNAVSVICWIWSSAAACVFCLAVCVASYYSSGPDPWSRHPVAVTLRKFSENLPFNTWHEVAADINREYQEVDKFVTMLSGWNVRTVATQSWILRLGRYRLDVAHQDLCELEVVQADDHSVSAQGDITGAQYVTIKVHTQAVDVSDFFIRINSREYDSFMRRVRCPVRIAEGVTIRKSLTENFLVVFREQVLQNGKVPRPEEIENCVGCYINEADVKLSKRCDGACDTCRCRPMWCLNCMGMWFAHQQDHQIPETWMTGTAPCPNCRSRFCILDVCLLE